MIVWSYNLANLRRNVDLSTLEFVIELQRRHLKFEVTGFGQFYDVNWDFLYQILMVKIQKVILKWLKVLVLNVSSVCPLGYFLLQRNYSLKHWLKQSNIYYNRWKEIR